MPDEIDSFALIAGFDRKRAEQFLEDVRSAAASEATAICLGEILAPSGIADARALRAYYLATRLDRRPTVREIELVFRVPSRTAQAILGRMAASFPVGTDSLLTTEVANRGHAEAVGAGNVEQYRITFPDNDPGVLDHAWLLLDRNGLGDESEREGNGILVSKKGLDVLKIPYKRP
jgi:hypothetical protein